jgi:hypothetical protein
MSLRTITHLLRDNKTSAIALDVPRAAPIKAGLMHVAGSLTQNLADPPPPTRLAWPEILRVFRQGCAALPQMFTACLTSTALKDGDEFSLGDTRSTSSTSPATPPDTSRCEPSYAAFRRRPMAGAMTVCLSA